VINEVRRSFNGLLTVAELDMFAANVLAHDGTTIAQMADELVRQRWP
jgi:hypothetical protein